MKPVGRLGNVGFLYVRSQANVPSPVAAAKQTFPAPSPQPSRRYSDVYRCRRQTLNSCARESFRPADRIMTHQTTTFFVDVLRVHDANSAVCDPILPCLCSAAVLDFRFIVARICSSRSRDSVCNVDRVFSCDVALYGLPSIGVSGLKWW